MNASETIQRQVSEQETGFDEGGKALHSSVAILMVGIGGLIGDANGKKCNQRRNQIEPGVGGFGKYAEGLGGQPNDNLERSNDERGENRTARDGALFTPHRIRAEGALGFGHIGHYLYRVPCRQLSGFCEAILRAALL